MKFVTNVHGTAPVGGVELHVFQMTQALAQRGHDIHLLYSEKGSLDAEYRQFCASVTQVPTVDYWFPEGRRGRVQGLAALAPTVWAASRRRPEVIYGNRIYSTGWAVPAGMLTRAPVVCHLHGHTDLRPKDIAFLNRHVARFVPVSHFVADLWVASGLDPAKTTTVHNAIDPADYPPGGPDERAAARLELGIPDDVFVVTYVGRLDREKGVDVLLRAWRRLGLGPDEGRLLIVGSSTVDHDGGANLAELQDLVDDSVSMLGSRRDVVTPRYAADVCAVPSRFLEPFGRTVIEGLSTGRPVVASRIGGIPEILDGDLEYLLVTPEDVDDLADRLRSLMTWHDDDPGLAERCIERVQRSFLLEQAVDRVEDILQTVAG
jgi:glycosyltransferase involved in cell wall biosynthesis